eukprot:8164009-Pyramimonas_sp.AAC.1
MPRATRPSSHKNWKCQQSNPSSVTAEVFIFLGTALSSSGVARGREEIRDGGSKLPTPDPYYEENLPPFTGRPR